jgi:RHS repeat-associated protein
MFTSPGANDSLCESPTIDVQAVTISGIAQPYGLCDAGHQGLFFDKEWDAYDNRARILLPDRGRFGQNDPAGYRDGMNLNVYQRMSPVNGLDPFGLEMLETTFTIECVEQPVKSDIDGMGIPAEFGYTGPVTLYYDVTVKGERSCKNGNAEWREMGISGNLRNNLDQLTVSFPLGLVGVGFQASVELEIERRAKATRCPPKQIGSSLTYTYGFKVYSRFKAGGGIGWIKWSGWTLSEEMIGQGSYTITVDDCCCNPSSSSQPTTHPS